MEVATQARAINDTSPSEKNELQSATQTSQMQATMRLNINTPET